MSRLGGAGAGAGAGSVAPMVADISSEVPLLSHIAHSLSTKLTIIVNINKWVLVLSNVADRWLTTIT